VPRGAPTLALRDIGSPDAPSAAGSARQQPEATSEHARSRCVRPVVRHSIQRPARGRRELTPAR
jgi:hypothetical protein